ncbi:39S ribosomal protein L1, mitochondrial isoform X2 [Rhinatrema bivittatum]|uniref:39S ribosomal protein L1, mitochondrial isoform X2 n=1 Tax=Rhinatrema bivittatum TaxID=194408 RepID=UPI00112D66EA|nr:39S ribosomal protein L1, mitochondrial isoform X2 [Rhinatrema bivittatum]
MALPVAQVAVAARFLQTAGIRCHAANVLRVAGRSLALHDSAPRSVPGRSYAAPSAKTGKKASTEAKKKKLFSKVEKEKPQSDTSRPKPFQLTTREPVDDVYMVQYYAKPIYEIETAIDRLKQFQQLDFTDPSQLVYTELRLDMTLEKKKKVDPFVSTLHLPYLFIAETNKVLVFTENADEAEIAENNGAAFVGGAELVEKILDEEIQADFYIAVPQILPKLTPLKDKLRKKFPKTKRGSVGSDIAKMLELFKTGFEYQIERDCFVRTEIATDTQPCFSLSWG